MVADLPTNIPSRNLVLQWEKERDQLVLDIRAANDKLNALQARIDAAWVMRTPPVNEDVVSSIVEYFNPVPVFPPVVAEELSRDERGRRELLRCLCELSKAWLNPCRRLLYHDFNDGPRANLFIRTLRNSLDLRPLVKRIYVNSWQIADYLSYHQMRQLSVIWVNDRSSVGSWLLPLKELKEVGFRYHSYLSSEEWHNAPTAWPKIETIRFHNAANLFGPHSLPASEPFSTLRTLEYNYMNLRSDFVPSITPNTLHTLRILCAVHIDPDFVKTIVKQHSKSLRRLEIFSTACSAPNDPFIDDTSTPSQLTSLRFTHNNFSLSDPMALPNSLVQLELDWPHCTPGQARAFIHRPSEALVEGRNTRRCFKLMGVEKEDDPEWETVRQEALGVGVRLLVDSKVNEYVRGLRTEEIRLNEFEFEEA